jgi:hypothetical protein
MSSGLRQPEQHTHRLGGPRTEVVGALGSVSFIL